MTPMKRVLALLALACALLAVSACHLNVDISVDASAELSYDNGNYIRIDPVTYGGFHRNLLTDSDLEQIFTDLTRNVSLDFRTAVLNLAVYDEISGKHLRDECYGVVYDSRTGHFDFADMNVVY